MLWLLTLWDHRPWIAHPQPSPAVAWKSAYGGPNCTGCSTNSNLSQRWAPKNRFPSGKRKHHFKKVIVQKRNIIYIYNYIYNYCILDTLAAPNYKVVRNFSCSHFQLTHSSEVSWTLQSPAPPLHSACLEECYRNPRSPCRHFPDPLEWFDKWYQQVQICWQYQKL